MKTLACSMTVAVLATMALAASETAVSQTKPMAPIEDTVEVSATVEKIDLPNRLLSLKTESGETVTVEVDPAVKNLPQVKVGDRVVARYRSAIGATIAKSSGQPVTVDTEAKTANPGERPAAHATQTTNVPVTINSVDTKTNQVTFHAEDGLVRSITVKTPQGKEFIKQLKAGDNVVISFTEAFAVSVEPAK